MNRRFRSVVAIAAALLGVASIASAQEPALRKRTAAEDLQLFSQVLNQIRVNHPDSIDTHDLYMAAIEAMVRAADPHSYVIPAARLAAEKEELWRRGRLVPVPISFSFRNGRAIVTNVVPAAKAARLDIMPGDELIAIDGQPLTAQSEAELEVTLAGPKNTSVDLTFYRQRIDGSQTEFRRTVVRERVEGPGAIPVALMLDSVTGYIRVTTFDAEDIGGDMNDRIETLEKQGMKQLVLDLRDNGGGRVDHASAVAGAFFPAGTVIYHIEGVKNEKPRTEKVSRVFWKKEKRYPLVVLVNRGTASAAELVAAALQDHDRALIVGEPTFGKALIMRYMPLSDGSLLALVVGHLKTPCGRVLQRQYRGVRRVDYYRMAGAEADTAGRLTCTSAGGRTLYGGGGVYPDVIAPVNVATPLWLVRANEVELIQRWAAAYITETGLTQAVLNDFVADGLPDTAVQQLRSLAQRENVDIPADDSTRQLLEKTMLRALAYAIGNFPEYYRVSALTDDVVQDVAVHFAAAGALAGVRR